MNDGILLQPVDPLRLASESSTFDEYFPVLELPRFSAAIINPKGELHYSFSFSMAEEGYCYIRMQAKADVELVCQRCLNKYSQKISVDYVVKVTKSLSNISHLQEKEDFVVLDEGKIYLKDLLEDELLLALPIVGKHSEEDKNCVLSSEDVKFFSENNFEEKKNNPFDVLKSLDLSSSDSSGSSNS